MLLTLYFSWNPCASSKLNPNIGGLGHLCLSLLNTWSGKKNELLRSRSTILQVIVSIQGLVLSPDPYGNSHPLGYTKHTETFKIMTRTYNEDAFLDSLRTMIHVIRRPLKVLILFLVHFYIITLTSFYAMFIGIAWVFYRTPS
jgi:ubiquitin-conjugating enzyme E2 O